MRKIVKLKPKVALNLIGYMIKCSVVLPSGRAGVQFSREYEEMEGCEQSINMFQLHHAEDNMNKNHLVYLAVLAEHREL